MFEFLLALICFLMLAISSIVLIPTLFLCEFFAQFLKICLSIKHRQGFKLVNNYDAGFLIPNDKPALSTINSYLIFQGTFDLQDIRYTVRNKWTDLKENNQYKHPLLRKHIVESFGYFFWQADQYFSIDDHVHLYACEPPKHQHELDDLTSHLCRQPLTENKSPWLLLLFQLDESFANEPQYVIFVRAHHCLGDGYNLSHMLNNCFLQEKYIFNLPVRPPKQFSTFNLLAALFYFPKHVIECLLSKDRNILHGPPQTGERYCKPMISCSLLRVKKLAKISGATINDVLVSCIAGALKRYFCKQKALPLGKVHFAIPIAIPLKYEDIGFKNALCAVVIPLAINDKGALERLKITWENTKELKDLPFYYVGYLVFALVLNRLPASITSLLSRAIDVTCVVTNVLLQQNPCFNKHGKQLVAYNIFPVHNSNIALAFAISSFNGAMRVGISADKAIMKKNDVDIFIKCFLEEFEELEMCSLKQH